MTVRDLQRIRQRAARLNASPDAALIHAMWVALLGCWIRQAGKRCPWCEA